MESPSFVLLIDQRGKDYNAICWNRAGANWFGKEAVFTRWHHPQFRKEHEPLFRKEHKP